MMNNLLKALRHNMRQALLQGRLDDGEQILARLKKEDPLGRETRGLELEFHLNSNRLEEACALAKQLCNLFPDSGRIHFLAGKVEYRMKNYTEAESRFRESQRVFPHWQALHWLGKTLTQTGRYDEAEALLLSVREHTGSALLDLAWLYERKNDLESALQKIEEYLVGHPGDPYASAQHLRLKAKMLEPEALIEEVDALAEHGEKVSDDLFLEYVERLFATGQTPRARDEVNRRMVALDEKPGVRLAWICYRARAYDLSCALFLNYLRGPNLTNYKYLAALESAARQCKRLPQVLDLYRSLAGQAPHLHGRIKHLRK
jgi:predicted Zn-dependent protease